MLTIHRTGGSMAKEPAYYVGDAGSVKELKGAKADKFLCSLTRKQCILFTSAHSTDQILLGLAEKGVKIYTAHWHKAGIEKGLEPTEIAAKFSLLSKDILTEYKPRPDLSILRGRVVARNAIVEYRKAALNQLGAVLRAFGAKKLPAWLVSDVDEMKMDATALEPKTEKQLIEEAKKIAECRIFNRVFGMKNGWVVAGQFVSVIGDTSRFPTVSSLWHYCGQHVINGKAPKRMRGVAMDWNPEARTILWKTIDAALKNNLEPIRGMYEKFKTTELAAHDEKCPDCKTKIGHCGARARRRVTKELLKEYYVLTGGKGQLNREIHRSLA